MPNGISIKQFCLKNKVPYNIFSKWYRDTRKKIVEVQVDGKPIQTERQSTNQSEEEEVSCLALDYSEGMIAEEQKRYRFGDKSQKSKKSKSSKNEKSDRNNDKDDFDGTSSSLPENSIGNDIAEEVSDVAPTEKAEMVATYHSIISTVIMQGRSAWEYLGKFFTKS